jgi:hypothetical protein
MNFTLNKENTAVKGIEAQNEGTKVGLALFQAGE